MANTRAGLIAALVTGIFVAPQPAWAEAGLDERIDQAVRPFADAVSGVIFSTFPVAGVGVPFVLVWLLVAASGSV